MRGHHDLVQIEPRPELFVILNVIAVYGRPGKVRPATSFDRRHYLADADQATALVKQQAEDAAVMRACAEIARGQFLEGRVSPNDLIGLRTERHVLSVPLVSERRLAGQRLHRSQS